MIGACISVKKVISILLTFVGSFVHPMEIEGKIHKKINSEILLKRIRENRNKNQKRVGFGLLGFASLSALFLAKGLANSDGEKTKSLNKDEKFSTGVANSGGKKAESLSKEDEQFIKKHFFLCGWRNNSCWNDVFIQFLMCPDILCKDYQSKKIMTTIKWIRKILNDKYYSECLERKVPVPKESRPISDGHEGWLTDGRRHEVDEMFFGKFDGVSITDMKMSDIFVEQKPRYSFYVNQFGSKNFQSLFVNSLGENMNKGQNYFILLQGIDECVLKGVNIFSTISKGYYPTYIVIHDRGLFYSYYVIYDKIREIKYLLLVDGLKSTMKVVSKEAFLNFKSNIQLFI